MDKRIAVRWQLSLLYCRSRYHKRAYSDFHRSLIFRGFVLKICNSRLPVFVVSVLTWSSNERNHARAGTGAQLSLNMTQHQHGGLELSVLKQRIKNALDINCKVHQSTSHRRQNVKLSSLATMMTCFCQLNKKTRA